MIFLCSIWFICVIIPRKSKYNYHFDFDSSQFLDLILSLSSRSWNFWVYKKLNPLQAINFTPQFPPLNIIPTVTSRSLFSINSTLFLVATSKKIRLLYKQTIHNFSLTLKYNTNPFTSNLYTGSKNSKLYFSIYLQEYRITKLPLLRRSLLLQTIYVYEEVRQVVSEMAVIQNSESSYFLQSLWVFLQVEMNFQTEEQLKIVGGCPLLKLTQPKLSGLEQIRKYIAAVISYVNLQYYGYFVPDLWIIFNQPAKLKTNIESLAVYSRIIVFYVEGFSSLYTNFYLTNLIPPTLGTSNYTPTTPPFAHPNNTTPSSSPQQMAVTISPTSLTTCRQVSTLA